MAQAAWVSLWTSARVVYMGGHGGGPPLVQHCGTALYTAVPPEMIGCIACCIPSVVAEVSLVSCPLLSGCQAWSADCLSRMGREREVVLRD